MKSHIFSACGVALLLVACGNQPKSQYVVTANLGSDFDGKTAYIYDSFKGENIDSAMVTNGIASFNNDFKNSTYAYIMIDDKSAADFFLTPDSISITEGIAKGGILNQKNDDFWKQRMATIEEFNSLPDSLQKEQYAIFQNRLDSVENDLMEENMDNALGIKMYLHQVRPETISQLDSIINTHPILKGNNILEKQRSALLAAEETSVGKMFKDFEINYNDSTFRLSEVVGNGKYVLVDFWASWCGPCIRQTSVIKDILKEYGPKGLEVIGVAVWDDPEKTLQGIKDHDLPWRNVINAQNIPSEIYGFQGIPCIILFGPDGTILSRDQQGEELKADVAKAFESK
ncbi:MAG: AhpC/TSA family protein [Muribaculaceae bacterium]|nr:AhpC/TSA family protein [Muribaculaceae bacterium]